MLPIWTILHPTDFSDYSNNAFWLACALARDYGARLLIVHVAEIPLPYYGEGLVLPPVSIPKEPLLEKLHELKPHDRYVRVEHRLVEGDAPTEILRIAEEEKCNLIVLGTHGRSGLGRLLMGSVAEQVVRKASCPVLTVKTPLSEVVSTEESVALAASAAK
jgi:nucleotide-binding universal stress UspA family protein